MQLFQLLKQVERIKGLGHCVQFTLLLARKDP
jgi:hypothetical protein